MNMEKRIDRQMEKEQIDYIDEYEKKRMNRQMNMEKRMDRQMNM